MKGRRIFYLILLVGLNFLQDLKGQCTCLEAKSEFTLAKVQLCENFESYALEASFPNNNNSWALWPNTTHKGTVKNIPGNTTNNKALLIQKNGTNSPDLLVKLGNKTTGRYRISWQMYVPKGSRGYYNFQHEGNVSTGHWAFEVSFLETGVGTLQLGNEIVSRFPFIIGAWNKVMHIVDLDTDEIELWINNEFVDAWKFSLGTSGGNPLLSNKLGAVNFYAIDQANFYIDNICVWERSFFNPVMTNTPVCLKNGRTVKNTYLAKNQFLYTGDEFSKEQCPEFCDFAGLNVKGTLNPRITSNDFSISRTAVDIESILPNAVINNQCLKDIFSEKSRKQLRGAIYQYKSTKEFSQVNIAIFIDTMDVDKIAVAVIDCNNSSDCILKYLYKPGERKSIGLRFSAEPNKEYNIIILTKQPLGFGLNISPEHIILDCDPFCPCTNSTKELNEPNKLVNQKTDNISKVEKLFTIAQKTYLGGELTYFVKIINAGIVNFSLEAKGDEYIMYLTGDKCNGSLIASASTGTNGTSSIAKYMESGIYNLTIDQLTLNPNAYFSLNYTLTPLPTNDQSRQVSCSVLNNQPHTVIIRGNPLLLNGDPLNLQDRIYLTNSRNVNNRESNAFNWNSNELKFILHPDNPADNLNCGYVDNEIIEFTIIRGNKVYAVTPIYQPVDGKEITGSNTFKKGAQSLIIGFIANLNVKNLGINSLPELTSAAKTFIAEINSNTSWKLERKNPSSENWLKFEPKFGDGIKDIKFTVDRNLFTSPRGDTLFLVNAEGFYKPIIINQPGCIGPVVTLSSSRLVIGNNGFIRVNVNRGTPGYKFQWFRNDTLISGQQDLIGLKKGVYKLVVTDANGCNTTFGPQLVGVTSTFALNLNKNIYVFPNPTMGQFHVQFGLEQNTPLELNLYDVMGKQIWHQARRFYYREVFDIDLSNQPAGIFWLQFKTDHSAFYKKIIRQ